MNTPLTELIIELNRYVKISSHPDYQKGLEYAIACAKTKLDSEKKMVVDAFEKSRSIEDGTIREVTFTFESAEQYFSTNYSNQK